MAQKADIGVIGLGVMGANLALNLADMGNKVAVFNRTHTVTEGFMTGEARSKGIVAADTVEELVALLETPRVVLIMVKAGEAVDLVIAQLSDSLEDGDVIIDGGNSLYQDTDRRRALVEDRDLFYLGLGVSGGEEGARRGPSLMPGGSPQAWDRVEAMLKGVAARAPDGAPCCEWLGEGGAGHFVKMVHNGIEYGDMQLIAEAYDLMRRGLGMEAAEIGETFAEWNKGRLRSYLIEITAEILVETIDDVPIVDLILDAAGQKGTGKWTVISSMDLGQPTSLVAEAVYARIVSSDPAGRQRASRLFDQPIGKASVTADEIESALYASKIMSYTQGFRLMDAASSEYGWNLDLATIASIWRAGCIIRADFLEDITDAYRDNPGLADLSESEFFADALNDALPAWRRVVADAAHTGVPAPAYSIGTRLFRLPTIGKAACQLDPGPAGLLRCPHLRTRRPPTWRVLPPRVGVGLTRRSCPQNRPLPRCKGGNRRRKGGFGQTGGVPGTSMRSGESKSGSDSSAFSTWSRRTPMMKRIASRNGTEIAVSARSWTIGLALKAIPSPAAASMSRSLAPSPIATTWSVGIPSLAAISSRNLAFRGPSTSSPSSFPVNTPSLSSSEFDSE